MEKYGKLILVRGIPGSGKSTFAKNHYPDYHHLETDMFFNVDGIYKFDKNKLAEYHEKCQQMTQTLLDKGENVIVTNTFIKLWELNNYLEMKFSDLTIIRLEGVYDNIHNVPTKVIKRMKNTIEDCMNEIIISQ